MSEIPEFPEVHPDAKGFIKQRGERFHPEPVRDVLIGEPAHKPVKVPGQAVVALGRKILFAMRAMIGYRPELYNLPTHRSGAEDEIEGALPPRLHAFRPLLRVEGLDVFTLAEGVAGRCDLHPVCHPQVPVLPPSPRRSSASHSPRRFRSREHMASLIIEIGPFVDEFEASLSSCATEATRGVA